MNNRLLAKVHASPRCVRARDPGSRATRYSVSARGNSLRAIADTLNRDKVPTAQGGANWYPATVRRVLLRTS